MASLKQISVMVSGLAILAFPLSAQAASRLDPAQAALCAAAMQLKGSESGNQIHDQIIYQKAADWFRDEGIAAVGSTTFTGMTSDHRKALENARLNGNAQYRKAVDGCALYYESSADDNPDTRITKRK